MAQNMNTMGQPMNSMTSPMGTMGQPMNNTGQPMNTGQSMSHSPAQPMGNMGQTMSSAVQSMANMGRPINSPGQPMGNMVQGITSTGQAIGNMGPIMNSAIQPMSNIPQPMNSMGQPSNIAGQSVNTIGQPMYKMTHSTDVGQPISSISQIMNHANMRPPSMSVANSNGGTNVATGAPEPPVTLVDEFERGFLACLTPLMDADMTNQDPDEMRAGAQQSLQKFLESAKAIEAFFLQKRLMLSVHKPELLLKEDITELRAELARKDVLIQKHYDKLQSWQDMLNNLQQGGQQPAPHPPTATPQATVQSTPTTQQSATTRHQTAPMTVSSARNMQSPHHMHQMGPQFPTIRGGQFHTADMMQGPLAKLERSTANIGMPDGWQ